MPGETTNTLNRFSKTKLPDEIEYAGDFNLNAVVIQNHKGEGVDEGTGGENILPQMQELNIYESIYKKALTGSIVIMDATNLIANLPIQGTERLLFKISTPGAVEDTDIVDATELTGHPFYIYKISNRKQISQGVLLYTLHFGSREFMRNIRTKVSKAYDMPIHQAVNNIFADKSGLDSRKKLIFEETRNKDKVVIPNMRPLDAIEMLSKRALPKNTAGAGYYFYETTKSFHFRSWESMCVTQGAFSRPVKATFQVKPANMQAPPGEDDFSTGGPAGSGIDPTIDKQKIIEDFEQVEQYEFVNNFHDVAANTAIGTYGHKVITHNIFNKTYKESVYNYHNLFGRNKHTEDKTGNPAFNKFQVSESPVDFDEKRVSDYEQSRISLLGTTQFLHNDDTGSVFGVTADDDGRLEGVRVSLMAQVDAGTKLKMIVKGQSYLEAGDMIQFNLLSVEPTDSDRFGMDPHYSGRYIISSIRHRITDQEYKMVLECIKDSVKEPFGSVDKFPGETTKETATFQNLYNRVGGRVGGETI